ncbi:DUF6588 family protein [Pedobacter sp. SYSU D00535]|uniref:DUF6588 family protein n=1 Tax=Pedobacter sp. SYSU D00535 TaxID=2810308 RepID=UPI001A95CC69|nr:DUF6588 family protein [Pedobacter sp. SYSU D00535]
MKISTKLKTILLFGGLGCSIPSMAQDEISDLIKASPADATALTRAYLEPFFKGTGLGLNSGWATTGTTKKLLRFDLKVGVTAAMPPTSAKTFDVTKIGLSNTLRPVNSNDVIAPTIAGAEEEGPRMAVYSQGNVKVTEFNLPQGLNIPMPGVQLQANIGLVKGFEAMVRYSPDIKAGDDFGTVGMKGGGLKFQPLKLVSKTAAKLVPVDLAVAVGYNSIKYAYDDIDVRPEEDARPKNASDANRNFDNQKFEVEFSGISVEAIASKKLFMFVPFVSVGYVTSNTKAGLYGNYPITTTATASTSTGTIDKQYEVFTDPVKIDDRFISGMRAAAGLNINLFLLHINASYNIAPYPYLNAGVSIGFGK